MPTCRPTTSRCSAGRSGFFSATAARPRSIASSMTSMKLHRLAAAALEHLAVGAEHVAERDVLGSRRWHQPAGHRRHREHHREVLRLRRADDVQQPRRLDPLDAVDDARQVARGVREGAGPAAHDQRQRLALAVREPGREHDLGAVGLLEQAGRGEPLDDLGHQRLVAALAGDVVVGEQHAELGVDVVPVLGALARRAPATARSSPGRAAAAARRAAGRAPGSRRRRRTWRWPPCRRRRGRRAPASRRRSTPPTSTRCSMSIPNGRPQSPMWFSRTTSWPTDVEHADERVADHRRAEVPDVHLLGDVRRRVVDDDPLVGGGRPMPSRSSAATSATRSARNSARA